MFQSLERAEDWTVETAGNLEHLIALSKSVFDQSSHCECLRNFVKPPITSVDDMPDVSKQVIKFESLIKTQDNLSPIDLMNESFKRGQILLGPMKLMKRYKNMIERVIICHKTMYSQAHESFNCTCHCGLLSPHCISLHVTVGFCWYKFCFWQNMQHIIAYLSCTKRIQSKSTCSCKSVWGKQIWIYIFSPLSITMTLGQCNF